MEAVILAATSFLRKAIYIQGGAVTTGPRRHRIQSVEGPVLDPRATSLLWQTC